MALSFSVLVVYSFVSICFTDVGTRVIYVSRCFSQDIFVDTLPGSGGNCTELDTALDQLSSDVTIVMEQGTHFINRSHHMDMRHVSNIKIIGAGADVTVITCADQKGLSFVGVTNITLVNFTITDCGLSGSNMIYHITLLSEVLDLFFMIPSATKIALFLGHCTNVMIQDVNITKTAGLGFLGINILGKSSIKRSGFTNNVRPKCLNSSPPVSPSLIDPGFYDQVGGGAYFLYADIFNSSNIESEVNLLLSELYFAHNADCTFAANTIMNFPYFTDAQTRSALYNYTIGAGGGLSVILSNRDFVVTVCVKDSIFYQNEARHGGGVFVATFAGFQKLLTVIFKGCIFAENGLTASYNSKYYNKTQTHCYGGAGIAIFTDLLKPNDFQNKIPTSGIQFLLRMHTTVFVNNAALVQGGGIFAYSLLKTHKKVSDINYVKKFYLIVLAFGSITFTNNSALYGSAGFFYQTADFSFDGSVLLYLKNITAQKNHYQVISSNALDDTKDTSTLYIKNIVCAFGDMTLENNTGSALRLDSTIASMQIGARLIFRGNIAHRGGALYLSGHSPALILHNNSLLHFQENTAYMEGGAIYYSPPDLSDDIAQSYNLKGCFLLTPSFSLKKYSDQLDIFDRGINIFFRKNQAPVGSTIYGSSLQSCSWAKELMSASGKTIALYRNLYRNFNTTFVFDHDPLDEWSISTPPASIIVKTGTKEPLEAYPGQTLPIEIQVLDFYNKTIPALVTSGVNTVNRPRTQTTLSESGFWYTDIANTTLSIASAQTGLISVSIFTTLSSVSTNVSVNLSSCPIGFELHQQNLKCSCSDLFLNQTSVTCNIKKISFEVLDTLWIGFDPTIAEPTSKDLILSRCAFNYCRIGNKSVPPAQIDSQCSNHRTGILCGSCNRKEGYSSVLGSYECKKCRNYMLFLIIVFAIAGAVLFSGIFFLEITIDKGWTNSIIFFCSVVAIYAHLNKEGYNIGFLPARLLNLQIGISLCFYDGMTSLSRTGLQLVFPMYLYVLMVVFTILCRHYSWMSTHFSPAKTLMTLSVMCYTSVLTTCVELLGAVRIVTFGGMNTSYRWYNDPNQVYFQGLHGFLWSISIVIILIYIIPFPILLLLPNLAYKHLVRFTPLFDALWAAYKPKYRFWLGIRLISVAFLFISTRLPDGYGITFGGIYAVVFFQLQGAILPFKEKVANYVEIFFLTIILLSYWNNLCLIAFNITYRVIIIAGVSLLVLTILPYLTILLLFFLHLHRQFPCLWQKFHLCLVLNYKHIFCKRNKTVLMVEQKSSSSQSDQSSSGHVRATSVHINYIASSLHESNLHFREPLLDGIV